MFTIIFHSVSHFQFHFNQCFQPKQKQITYMYLYSKKCTINLLLFLEFVFFLARSLFFSVLLIANSTHIRNTLTTTTDSPELVFLLCSFTLFVFTIRGFPLEEKIESTLNIMRISVLHLNDYILIILSSVFSISLFYSQWISLIRPLAINQFYYSSSILYMYWNPTRHNGKLLLLFV